MPVAADEDPEIATRSPSPLVVCVERHEDAAMMMGIKQRNTSINEGKSEEEEEDSLIHHYSEWQIQLGGTTTAVRENKRFESSAGDFRDPRTGESVLAADAYGTLVHEIVTQRNVAFCEMIGVVVVVCSALMAVRHYSDQAYWKLVLSYGMAFLVVHVKNLIYKTLDSRIQKLADKRCEDFRVSYGVEVGYRPSSRKFLRFWNDNSHVWLRRSTGGNRRRRPSLLPEEHEVSHREAFPPIYLLHFVPGDCYIHEKDYHASMHVDENTWKLIQKTHRKAAKLLCVQVFLLFLLLSVFPLVVLSLGVGETIGLWKGVFGVVFCFGVLLAERRALKSYELVAETVTRTLNNTNHEEITQHDDGHEVSNRYGYPTTAAAAAAACEGDGRLMVQVGDCYSLQFKTTPLLGRPGALSRRYQLVRKARILKVDDDATAHCGCEDDLPDAEYEDYYITKRKR